MSQILNTLSFFRITLFVAILCASFSLRADWINLTGAETAPNIAEIYILDDQVKLVLEIYVGNLELVESLIPDELLKDKQLNRKSQEERLRLFSENKFQFVTETGKKLPAELVLLEQRLRKDRQSLFAGKMNPYTRQRVPDAPTDKRVLYIELSYPFNIKPKELTIVPPADDEGRALVSFGFITYHKSVPIIDFRYLGAPARLTLDWDDPWYTKFDNKNLTRHHKYPLMLYLYVEPRQVRLESLLRISDIAELTDFDMGASHANAADKYQQLQEHIKNYYTDNEALKIDGISYKPNSIRTEFLHATLTGLKVIENASAVGESSLLVGVSQQYYIESLPQRIESRWPYFNQRIDRIPVIVTDPVGPFQSFVEKNDAEFGWQNFLKKYSEPVIRPVVIETGWNIDIPYVGKKKIFKQLPDEQQTLNIVDGVLENLRITYFEKEPGKLSHVLSEVVSSDDAEVLQKELAKLFAPKVTGGAVGAVQAFGDIQIINMRELGEPDGFSSTISGSASISAQHW